MQPGEVSPWIYQRWVENTNIHHNTKSNISLDFILIFFIAIQLPISPSQRQSLEESFVVVSDGEDTHSKDDLHDVISRLEEQLQKQLTMCKTTR